MNRSSHDRRNGQNNWVGQGEIECARQVDKACRTSSVMALHGIGKTGCLDISPRTSVRTRVLGTNKVFGKSRLEGEEDSSM